MTIVAKRRVACQRMFFHATERVTGGVDCFVADILIRESVRQMERFFSRRVSAASVNIWRSNC